ncbi:MAG: hypothetical protein ABI763_03870 [Bacteroidota bacterium]
MNKAERFFYNFIKANPRIKNVIRDVYQSIFSLLPVKQGTINDSLVSREGYFFGFHDKSPWCFDDTFLLANKFLIPNRKINKTDSIEVGIFKGGDWKEFVPLARTQSFNWQQGCFSQWVGQKKQIIYNSYDGLKNISIIIDIDGKEIKRFNIPVAAVSPDGKYALSYNFNRLAKYAEGYGYENGIDEEEEVMVPTQQGLSIINIETREIKKLFTVAEIAAIDPDPAMDGAFHFFTHCLFSPSGKRFVFYHRSIRDMNFVRTRMFSCDLNGEHKFIFPTAGMVSHIGWKDEKNIMSYCRVREKSDGYFLFEDESNNYQQVGEAAFTSDGHPSFSPADSKWFITDTYPNRFRLSRLMLFNLQANRRVDLAKLKQPLQFKNELRCDLHPRWNRAGTVICFDSAHTGTRSLCTLNVSEELKLNR